MARAKKTTTEKWALKAGHPTIFRRTVEIGTGKNAQRVQLVFEPDTPYELTGEELEGLQADIDGGMIVPWNDGDRRLRPVANPTQTADVRALQRENESLRAQVEELTEQLAEATAPHDDATDSDGEKINHDAPLGDEAEAK